MVKGKYTSALIILTLLALAIFSSGCSAEEKVRTDVNKQQEHYRATQPNRFYDWSLELQTVQQIYDARNQNIATHTVWRSDFGTIEGDCDSIGYPVPYDVQLTNPLQRDNTVAIEQAKPNGLYSSKSTSATWIRAVLIVDGEPTQVPIYVEGKVTCYPYPVDVNYTTNRVTPKNNAMPSVILSSERGANVTVNTIAT